jgi:uncharacterized protein
MAPKVDTITITVDDLEKSVAFYKDGLGLPTEGIIGTEFEGDDVNPAGAIAFFKLQNNLTLGLYPRTELPKDANRPAGTPNNVEFSLAHFVNTKEEVDALLARAERAGGTITDKPHDRPWGIYSGYFQDLDGHLWEVIYGLGQPTSE